MKIASAFALAAALSLSACGPASIPCGTFAFNGTPDGSSGVSLTQSFQFGPAPCATACTTNTIAYVQVIRVYDMDTGEYLAPGPEQQARIVTGQADAAMNGWAVDRLEGRTWGYYGRYNDGTFASTLTPGSNATAAVLSDYPSGWPAHSWFDAIDVPICIDSGSTCLNNELGYAYWLFFETPDASGNAIAGTPFSEIGRDWHRDAVDLAVAKWNANAPGLGKNQFPAFTRMN